MYEMYNPTILKIETLLLEKRLDEDLTYLCDALPEYSKFNFNMEPVRHPPGKPVPINPLKVGLIKFYSMKQLFCLLGETSTTPMVRQLVVVRYKRD
jgi:hypothetical protein